MTLMNVLNDQLKIQQQRLKTVIEKEFPNLDNEF